MAGSFVDKNYSRLRVDPDHALGSSAFLRSTPREIIGTMDSNIGRSRVQDILTRIDLLKLDA